MTPPLRELPKYRFKKQISSNNNLPVNESPSLCRSLYRIPLATTTQTRHPRILWWKTKVIERSDFKTQVLSV